MSALFFWKLSSLSVERRKLIWALTMVRRDELDVDELLPADDGLALPPSRPGGPDPLRDDVDRCPPVLRLAPKPAWPPGSLASMVCYLLASAIEHTLLVRVYASDRPATR